MNPGDLVIHQNRGDGDVDGKYAIIMDFVDENLNSGRMCYVKILINGSIIRYVSPTSLQVINEPR